MFAGKPLTHLYSYNLLETNILKTNRLKGVFLVLLYHSLRLLHPDTVGGNVFLNYYTMFLFSYSFRVFVFSGYSFVQYFFVIVTKKKNNNNQLKYCLCVKIKTRVHFLFLLLLSFFSRILFCICSQV